MPTSFTAADLVRLKGDAKALRASAALTQTQALDAVARRHGHQNWALLQRSITTAAPTPASQALQLQVEPYRGGDAGVFVLSITVIDRPTQRLLEREGGLVFELPPCPPRWIIRRFTGHDQVASDPYLELSTPSTWTGRFMKGKFFAIVSVNGLHPGYVRSEVETELGALVARVHQAAIDALEARTGAAGASTRRTRVRLFYTVRNAHGTDSLCDESFATVDAAQAVDLPEGASPVSIWTRTGWWTFSRHFGWEMTNTVSLG